MKVCPKCRRAHPNRRSVCPCGYEFGVEAPACAFVEAPCAWDRGIFPEMAQLSGDGIPAPSGSAKSWLASLAAMGRIPVAALIRRTASRPECAAWRKKHGAELDELLAVKNWKTIR